MTNLRISLLAAPLVASVSLLSAAAPAIGVAVANGNITVNNAQTAGNAPIFEGNTIETGKTSSRLQFQKGGSIQMGSSSKGTVYGNRFILEKGMTEFKGHAYEIDAKSLRILGDSARVSVRGPVVQVAALTGTVRVRNANGIVLASLAPGRALDFTPQEGASAASTMTGCLSRTSSGAYLLTDETSNVVAELRGGDLAAHVRHRISVTGAMMASATPVGGASQVVNVTDIKMLGTNCTNPAAAGMGAGAGAAAATGAGVGSAATAVVAGVIVAAAVGTTVGVLATQGQSTPTQQISPVR